MNNNDNEDNVNNGKCFQCIFKNIYCLPLIFPTLYLFPSVYIHVCVCVRVWMCVHLRICTYLHICLYLSSCFFSVHYWSPQSLPQWLTFCFAIVFIHLQLPLSHLWPSWSARVNCLNNLIRCYCLHE